MENQEVIFKSNYLLRLFNGEYNPFRPTLIKVNEDFIEHKKRNWHLITADTQTFHFQYVAGIDVKKHIFSASMRISTTGSDKIVVKGFSKKTANQIKDICSRYIAKNTQRGTTEALSGAIADAVSKVKSSGAISVSEELKKLKGLLDEGTITQSEYEGQKAKLLNL